MLRRVFAAAFLALAVATFAAPAAAHAGHDHSTNSYHDC
jgi:hypothetical protein